MENVNQWWDVWRNLVDGRRIWGKKINKSLFSKCGVIKFMTAFGFVYRYCSALPYVML